MDRPPYDASPKYLVAICNYIGDKEVLKNDVYANSVDLSRTVIQRNIQLGIELRFLEEVDGEYLTTTDYGKMLGRANELSNSTEWLFEEGISQFPFYSDLLETYFKLGLVGETDGEECIEQSKVTELLHSHYDFDFGDRTLDAAARTFLRTIEAAGLGDYKRGRGGRDTRVILNEQADRFRPEDLVDQTPSREEQETGEDEDDEATSDVAITRTDISETPHTNVVINVNVELEGDVEEKAESVQKFINNLNKGLEE